MKTNFKDLTKWLYSNHLIFLFIGVLLLILNSSSLLAQDASNGSAAGTSGGQGGQTVTVNSLSSFESYAESSTTYTILVDGTISSSSFKIIDVNSNKTIVGLGSGSSLRNIELRIIDKHNIIIRNLTIADSYVEGDWDGKTQDNDGVQSDRSYDIWIDHCHFTHLGDGCIDLRDGTDDVTVSYCKFSNHNKTFGIGWTDETGWNLTIHHCYFDGTGTRNPSFDQGRGHLYNNYLRNISSYGNLARGNARLIVESSRFDNVNDPLKITDNGQLYSSGNSFNSCSGNQSGNTSSKPWTPGYSYSLDNPSYLRTELQENTGPQSYISDQYTGNGGTVYQFQNRSTGQFIDGYGRTGNGDACAQYGNTTHPNSQWRAVDAGSGYVYLVNVGTGMKLDGYGRTSNGSVCAQYSGSTTHPNAQWKFVDAGSGYVYIENRGTGMRVDGYGWTVNGRDLMQYYGTTHPNAQWQRISLKSASLSNEESDMKDNANKELVVYPNPAIDAFTMVIPESIGAVSGVSIYNRIGQKVKDVSSIVVGENQIDISELSAGIYYVQIATREELISKVIAKQ